MSTLTIPDALPVTVWHGVDEFTVTTAKDILAIPTAVEGVFDGPSGWAEQPEPPSVMFSFGWFADIAGYGWEDLGHLAAELGAHLAGHGGDWPSGTAHVRGMPVVSARFSWMATPQRLPPAHKDPGAALLETVLARMTGTDPEAAARLRSMLTANRCECKGCTCSGG